LKRKKRPPEFKRKVAIEVLRERETINAIAARYEVHPVQVCQWKKELEEGSSSVFTTDEKLQRELKALKAEKEELQQLIGKQAIALEWLKKKLGP
jgi:transposase-like protein